MDPITGAGIWTRIATEVRKWVRELWRTRRPKARRTSLLGRFLADRKRRTSLARQRARATSPSAERALNRQAPGADRQQILMQAMGYLAAQPGRQAPARAIAGALRKPTRTVTAALTRGPQVRQVRPGVWTLSAVNPRAARQPGGRS
jgi:hypothetical protein